MTPPDVPTDLAAEVAAAATAAPGYGAWSDVRRRDLLHACADVLTGRADAIVPVAMAETGLTEARLRGEMARTTDQLRQMGDFAAAGRHRDDRRSTGVAAGADVIALAVPIGPVAVFAASNFPLAFGVAGGDTASALAAGCPVVVKAHPAQPATSRLIVAALRSAAGSAGAPPGTIGFVEGGADVSIALVTAAPIRAVGFTGSLAGGRALMAAAASRPDPIPVYAEMGSLNPVFVLPGAVAVDSWPAVLAGSVTGSAGQLCTKPGLVVCPDTDAGRAFADALATAVAAAPAHPMLTASMAEAHRAWRATAASHPGVSVVTAGGPDWSAPVADGQPFVVRVAAADLAGDLVEEHFGPAVVVALADVDDYAAIAARLEGALTATMLGGPADEPVAAALLPRLAAMAGRVIWNGVPTGVAVCDAMVHGGPWPATSAPSTTSVGTAAIFRFLRPVALQGLPDSLAATIGAPAVAGVPSLQPAGEP